jgi:uncharacterized protein YjiS (DUF1127 family)
MSTIVTTSEHSLERIGMAGRTSTRSAWRRAVGRLARTISRPFVTHYQRERTVRELSALDDRWLADIGIKRADIPVIAKILVERDARTWSQHAAGANGFGG